nr:DNA topoisomerase IB [uncultured Sphingomonas sp.]
MLRHSNDREPGYARKRQGKSWAYFDEQQRRVARDTDIRRLNAIALPPAYTGAWFCKDDNGHLQATGIDARGRKQYRYHPDYRAWRDSRKFGDCASFGDALPRIRARVAGDLASREMNRTTVLAAVVRLLDRHHVRVGNEVYAEQNNHYGATTLRRNHLKITGNDVRLLYPGKEGVIHNVVLTDSKLKKVVKKCQELPGQHLFHYRDGNSEMRAVSSSDVNDYLRDITGDHFTAKDFRTWGASVIFFDELLSSPTDEKILMKDALQPVADALGNTPAISRKSYVHPRLIAAVQANPTDPLNAMKRPRARKWLSSAETGFLKFLGKKGHRSTNK